MQVSGITVEGRAINNSVVTFTKVLWKTVLLVSGSPTAFHSQEDVNHFHSV